MAGRFKVQAASEAGAGPARGRGWVTELPRQGARGAWAEAADEAAHCSFRQLSCFHPSVMEGCAASPCESRPQTQATKPVDGWGGRGCSRGRQRDGYGGCWCTQGPDKLLTNAIKIA